MRLLSVFIFLFSLHAAAADGVLGPNDIYISGEVVSVTSLCPSGATCVVGGTTLTLRFILPNSCFSLSAVDYKVSNNNTKVEVTAVQSDKTPADSKCLSKVVEVEKSISLVSVFPPFDLFFTGNSNLSFPTKISAFN